MNKFKVLIIGAGKIGAFFDKPGSENILTHAHAFSGNEAFELIGFVDPDINKAKDAATVWGGESYKNIDEAYRTEVEIDVACVCVPDEYHYDVLKELSGKPLKLVFAEKPITKSEEEAREILELFKKKEIPLLINYSRRFVPEFAALKGKIAQGEFGNFMSGTAYYGKGIIHNGSHMIDLIRSLLSDIGEIIPVSRENDFYPDDPSVSAVLSLHDGGKVSVMNVDCRNYSIFELDLLFEKGRISIKDSGNRIEYFDLLESDVYAGYKYLNKKDEIKTGLNKSLFFAVLNIREHLESQKTLLCTGEEAYLTLRSSLLVKQRQL